MQPNCRRREGKFTDVPVKHKISRCVLLCAVSVTDNAVLVGWCVRPKFLLALRRTQLQQEEEFFFCSDAFLVWLAGDSCASRSNLVGIKTNESNQEGRQAADIKKILAGIELWLVQRGVFRPLSSRLCRCASLRVCGGAVRSWKRPEDQKCQKCDQERLFPSEVSRAVPGSVQYNCRLM